MSRSSTITRATAISYQHREGNHERGDSGPRDPERVVCAAEDAEQQHEHNGQLYGHARLKQPPKRACRQAHDGGNRQVDLAVDDH